MDTAAGDQELSRSDLAVVIDSHTGCGAPLSGAVTDCMHVQHMMAGDAGNAHTITKSGYSSFRSLPQIRGLFWDAAVQFRQLEATELIVSAVYDQHAIWSVE